MKRSSDKKSYIFTRETFGMTILLFCSLVFIMLLTNNRVFSDLGSRTCAFLYGTFGYGAYLILALFAYLGQWLIFGKSVKIKAKNLFAIACTLYLVFALFHAISTNSYQLTNFNQYISQCFKAGDLGFEGYTFGGIISAVIVYPIAKATTFIGSYIILSILVVLASYLTYLSFKIISYKRSDALIIDEVMPEDNEEVVDSTDEVAYTEQPQPQQVNENILPSTHAPYVMPSTTTNYSPQVNNSPVHSQVGSFSDDSLGRRILFENGEFAAESYRRNRIYNENSYFNNPVQSTSEDYLRGFAAPDAPYTRTPKPVESGTQVEQSTVVPSSYLRNYEEAIERESQPHEPVRHSIDNSHQSIPQEYEEIDTATYPVFEEPVISSDEYEEEEVESSAIDESFDQEIYEEDYMPDLSIIDEAIEEEALKTLHNIIDTTPEETASVDETPTPRRSPMSSLFSAGNTNYPNTFNVEPDTSVIGRGRGENSPIEETNVNLFDDEEDSLIDDSNSLLNNPQEEEVLPTPPVMRPTRATGVERIESMHTTEPQVQPEVKHVWKQYVKPSLDLLQNYDERSVIDYEELENNKRAIVNILTSQKYKIACSVLDPVVGPTFTRYDVIIEDITKIKEALSARDSIALAMKCEINCYINYYKGAMSIEVPNRNRGTVGLKGILQSPTFVDCKKNTITFALGKNADGDVVCPDITKMPHLLVAGSSGSGKSVCLSSLIISLLYKYGPEELRFILVDPKQVEFIPYDKLPHLMINEIIFEVDKAIKALNWAIAEMERRYALFKDMTEKGVATKDLEEYNKNIPDSEEKLPKIVIILDEFGDLMLANKKSIESRIIKLVQKARACGIHLILATQRPSVDCITGLIKSNLPTRIGFKVGSFDDSRTIFDIGGAEKLCGKGDMYFRSADKPELLRAQGCFVSSEEVQRVTDFVKMHNETYFDQKVSEFINKEEEKLDGVESLTESSAANDSENKIDDTYIRALKFCIQQNQASVSMLQRRFPIGYMKACKIIDWMERMNYVSVSAGSKPRSVLVSMEEFVNKYGDIEIDG